MLQIREYIMTRQKMDLLGVLNLFSDDIMTVKTTIIWTKSIGYELIMDKQELFW